MPRRIAAVTLAALTCAALAACGSNRDTETDRDPPTMGMVSGTATKADCSAAKAECAATKTDCGKVD